MHSQAKVGDSLHAIACCDPPGCIIPRDVSHTIACAVRRSHGCRRATDDGRCKQQSSIISHVSARAIGYRICWRQVRPFHVAVPVISLLRSNKKQINWDQLDKEVSAELEGEKLEGDAALNKLFKDIYDRADEVCMPLIHSVTAYTL